MTGLNQKLIKNSFFSTSNLFSGQKWNKSVGVKKWGKDGAYPKYSSYATNLFFKDTESVRAKRFQDRNSMIYIKLSLKKYNICLVSVLFHSILSCLIESFEKLLLLFNADICSHNYIIRKRSYHGFS